MIRKIGKILSDIPSWFLIVPVILIIVVLRFADIRTSAPVTEESRNVFNIIQEIKPGSKVMILVNYGPEGIPELEESLTSLITFLARKEVGIVFATMIPAGIETTSMAVERGLSALKTNENRYLYGRDFVNLGYIAGGPVAAAMLTGSLKDQRRKELYGYDLKNMSVMNGINNFDDLSGFFEFSSTKIDDVPGVVFISMFSAQGSVPKVVFCTSDMVSDYIPFVRSGSIDAMSGGFKNIVAVVKLLDPGSNEDKRYFIAVAVLIYFLLMIIIANIGRLMRGKE